ncbi:hypothetical protein NDU88_001332 [Pleurodeles waltl]|uniref:Uncharacterized protein n=1 Tax=Pleurodeles waltl TaxID=8319 RepID=A0AAV7VA42_PLEWA|nr:hypothetical protein NDU88_001332 [Pleurodeles waltl]
MLATTQCPSNAARPSDGKEPLVREESSPCSARCRLEGRVGVYAALLPALSSSEGLHSQEALCVEAVAGGERNARAASARGTYDAALGSVALARWEGGGGPRYRIVDGIVPKRRIAQPIGPERCGMCGVVSGT